MPNEANEGWMNLRKLDKKLEKFRTLIEGDTELRELERKLRLSGGSETDLERFLAAVSRRGDQTLVTRAREVRGLVGVEAGIGYAVDANAKNASVDPPEGFDSWLVYFLVGENGRSEAYEDRMDHPDGDLVVRRFDFRPATIKFAYNASEASDRGALTKQEFDTLFDNAGMIVYGDEKHGVWEYSGVPTSDQGALAIEWQEIRDDWRLDDEPDDQDDEELTESDVALRVLERQVRLNPDDLALWQKYEHAIKRLNQSMPKAMLAVLLRQSRKPTQDAWRFQAMAKVHAKTTDKANRAILALRPSGKYVVILPKRVSGTKHDGPPWLIETAVGVWPIWWLVYAHDEAHAISGAAEEWPHEFLEPGEPGGDAEYTQYHLAPTKVVRGVKLPSGKYLANGEEVEVEVD